MCIHNHIHNEQYKMQDRGYAPFTNDELDQLAGPKKGPPESDTGPVGRVPTVWEMLH